MRDAGARLRNELFAYWHVLVAAAELKLDTIVTRFRALADSVAEDAVEEQQRQFTTMFYLGQERLHQQATILEGFGDVSSVTVEFVEAKTVAAVGASANGRLYYEFIPIAVTRQGRNVLLFILGNKDCGHY